MHYSLTPVGHSSVRSLEEPTCIVTRCKFVVAASKKPLKVAVGGSTE